MSQYFITGGSGYLGRHLIETLCANGHTVHALTRSKKAQQVVESLGAKSCAGDLDSRKAMTESMTNCAGVIHSAALASEWGTREEFYRVNVDGTRNTLEAAKEAKVPVFVHIGTEAMLWGDGPIIMADEARPAARRPAGFYSWSKGLADRIVRDADGPAMRAVVVRPRLIWGKDDTTILPKIISKVERGIFLWIDGGRYRTSTCHVDNVCEGVLLALEKGRGGEAYFLTDGEPVEYRDFVSKILSARGIIPPDKSIPHWLVLLLARTFEAVFRSLRLPGKPPVTVTEVRLVGEEITVSDRKAREELGYVGKTSIGEGIAELKTDYPAPGFD
jgi:nucleoside-diphosphate-sugar epimerase